jgi:DNA-binding response OmpR family regulator
MTPRPRLLIVEDEADAAASLELLLEPRGYQVQTAATAAEARRRYEEWRPGLVLMDLMLPDASGLDLLVEFKAASAEVQVIMVTG